MVSDIFVGPQAIPIGIRICNELKLVLVRGNDPVRVGGIGTLSLREVTQIADFTNHEVENRAGILLGFDPFLLCFQGTGLKSKDAVDHPKDNQGQEYGYEKFHYGKALFTADPHLSFFNFSGFT